MGYVFISMCMYVDLTINVTVHEKCANFRRNLASGGRAFQRAESAEYAQRAGMLRIKINNCS